MSILARALSTAAPIAPVRAQPTMHDVWQATLAAGKLGEAKSVARLGDYFGKSLTELTDLSLDTFDQEFPLAKREDRVPGRQRSFWRSRDAYNRWRNKVRPQIERFLASISGPADLIRLDHWSALLDLMKVLTKDGGPIHAGELGAVRAFADRARTSDIEPHDLTTDTIWALLDPMSPERRAKALRALRVLERYSYIRRLAEYLPAGFKIAPVVRKYDNSLPKLISDALNELVEGAAHGKDSFDKTTDKYTDRCSETTLDLYRSALRTYAASTERAGCVDLDQVTDIRVLFEEQVFYAVVRYWTDISDDPAALSARSADQYCRNIATVLGRNEIECTHISQARRTNPYLLEGREAGEGMSKKTIAFCAPLARDKVRRRRFMTQHLEYRRRAQDILATDKALTKAQLREARLFGVCAAFAAVEIAGAPFRVINTLQLRHRGPTSNILLPSGQAPHYLVMIAASEMKVPKQMEPVRIRTNALEGRQTLDWYLREIRPLFPYGNASWCAGNVDLVDPRVRDHFDATTRRRSESIHVFVAPTSDKHLSKGLFYEWLLEASDAIGLPMTAHNFRHGIATVLVKRSLANIERVAILLNNKPGTVRRNYAFIHREAVIEETQNELVAELLG